MNYKHYLKMKKVILLIFIAMASIANSQTWTGFTNTTPTKIGVDVITSTSQSVSFNVSISGIYTKDTLIR